MRVLWRTAGPKQVELSAVETCIPPKGQEESDLENKRSCKLRLSSGTR